MNERKTDRILTDAVSGLDEDIINEVSEQRYASVKIKHKKTKRAALLIAAVMSCLLVVGASVFLKIKDDTVKPSDVVLPSESAFSITESGKNAKTVIYSQEQTIHYSRDTIYDSSKPKNNSGNLIYGKSAEMKIINDEKNSDALFYAVLDCSGSYLWEFYKAAGYLEKYGYDECLKLEQNTMLSYFEGLGVKIDEYGEHLYIGKFSYSALKTIDGSKQFPDDMVITLLPADCTLKDLLK